jgi:AAA domain
MLNYKEFVEKPKSMLIAPAGYGKTHTIAECLKHTKGKQLILTHTHAGIVSIKEKIKKANIQTSSYNVETISSFAQKYVLSFAAKDCPPQENSKLFYPFIIKKAIDLIKLKPIADIVANTYTGLFVDEYQDCTMKQHELILALSNILPTHLLGDFMQGIFGFAGKSVDLLDEDCMGEFLEHREDLTEPFRWKDHNEPLGEDLKAFREKLLKKEVISISEFESFETTLVGDYSTSYDSGDIKLFTSDESFKKLVYGLRTERSLLVIYPDPKKKTLPREQFIKTFGDSYLLLEPTDIEDSYEWARKFDIFQSNDLHTELGRFFDSYFSNLTDWFQSNRFKNKRNPDDRAKVSGILPILTELETAIDFSKISLVIGMTRKLPNVRCCRRDLVDSVCKALEEAQTNNSSVYDAMVKQRNHIRRKGRKVFGKCIGTTLLTKGLEFDTVLIINAHKFECPKNLYVAATRACKRLIITTTSMTLNPKYN